MLIIGLCHCHLLYFPLGFLFRTNSYEHSFLGSQRMMTHYSSPCRSNYNNFSNCRLQLQQSQLLQQIQETCARLTASIEEDQASQQQALRAQIENFTQLDGEFYYQAWDRFNNLLSECPQHGFDLYHLIELFYEGLQLQMQKFVNNEGDFFDKEPEEARAYLEAMAENDRKWELTFYIRTVPAGMILMIQFHLPMM